MSDYIGITEGQTNPFSPLTSELVKQLRDNPIAIAEAASGAPRISAKAMTDVFLGEGSATRNSTGNTPILTILDMENIHRIIAHMDVSVLGAASAEIRYSTSVDNGDNWSSETGLLGFAGETHSWVARTRSLLIPSGVNAVRFRLNQDGGGETAAFVSVSIQEGTI